MPDQDSSRNQPLDDQLADFVDALLESGDATPVPAEENAELNALEETAVRLARTFGPVTADPAFARRIEENLAAEWEDRQAQAARRQRRVPGWYALAGAAAVFAILLGISLLAGGEGSMTGAAGATTGAGVLALAGLVVLILAAVVWWIAGRRRR
jgi:hypothetical protein